MRGPWAALAVSFDRDARIMTISNDAELLYVRLLLWTVEQKSDGRFPRSALGACARGFRNVETVLRELTECDLVKPVQRSKNEYTFPPKTWAEYQQTRDNLEDKRARHAEKMRAWRAKSRDGHGDTTRDGSVTSLQYKPDTLSNSHIGLATGARSVNGLPPPLVWDLDDNGNLVRLDRQANEDH